MKLDTSSGHIADIVLQKVEKEARDKANKNITDFLH